MYPAVAVGQGRGVVGDEAGIGAVDGQHQRPFAAPDECLGLRDVVVGHERGHGAEHFGGVQQAGVGWVTAAQQRGGHAGGHGGVGIQQRGMAAVKQHLGFGLERRQARLHRVELGAADQRSHANVGVARVAHGDLGQTCADGLRRRVVECAGHEHAPDGGAFLAALDSHLAHHFLHQQVEGGAVRAGRWVQQGGVDAVGLDVAAHRVLRHRGMAADDAGRLRRAGE